MALAAVALGACGAAPAAATVGAAQPIDGPSPDIVDLGGVAMASDGTGGIVYRKRVGGVPHVFAARFADGRWSPPQRVDAGHAYTSSWPRIAAGRGGLLHVTWVQEAGPDGDRLYGAVAGRGFGDFAGPVLIDGDVGEATATWPTLASNDAGQAYVAYRVPTVAGRAEAGYASSSVKLARYRGPRWSSLGVIARNQAALVREPNAGNGPRVGVDQSGSAVVAWQEPDDDRVDRIWARRVFSSGLGLTLPVSPAPDAGSRSNADAFALAVGALGEAVVVSRSIPQGGGAPRLLVNAMPASVYPDGGTFTGARTLTEPTPGLGLPTVATVDERWFATAASGAAALIGTGTEKDLDPLATLEDLGEAGDPAPVAVAGESGARVLAWRLARGDASGVGIAERTPGGKDQRASVSTPPGGAVAELAAAGSGLGDAIVGFRQELAGSAAVAAAFVDAPPHTFGVSAPVGWVRPGDARVAWEPAPIAGGTVKYALLLDGERLPSQRSRQRRPHRGRLADGSYPVQVLATDGAGQQALSNVDRLRVDGTPPEVSIRPQGRRVRIDVADGQKGRVSGVAGGATRARFGDGKRGSGGRRVTYEYDKPGRYRVQVRARDRAGNRVVVRERVRIR